MRAQDKTKINSRVCIGNPLAPVPSALLLDCPFCGRPVPYPGLARGGVPALAVCLDCDLDYEFDPGEVYAA